MKKHFFAALFLGLAFTSFAQDLYIKPYAGYGLGFNGEHSTIRETDSTHRVFRGASLNHGAGVRGGLSVGVLFEDGLGLDFDLSYQNNLGQGVTSTIYDIKESLLLYSYSIQFTPSLHFELDRASVKPYLDVGPSLLYSSFQYTSKRSSSGYGGTERTAVYEGNFTMGATSNLGLEFELSRHIFLNTAVRYVMAYSSPSRSELILAKNDGEDVLDDIRTYQRETEYVNEIRVPNNFQSLDYDSPYRTLKRKFNYSSISLLVGLKFVIN